MRVIMAPTTEEKQVIQPWLLKELSAGYQLIDFREEEKLKQITGEIEPDFEIQLGHEQVEWIEELEGMPFVFVTIGPKQISHQVSCYYEMTKQNWEKEEAFTKPQSLWICCYSEGETMASHLIMTIQELLNRIKQFHKSAIIYLDAMPKASYFLHRSLTYKLINDMLGDENFLLQVMKRKDRAKCYLPSHRNYEPYKNRFLYGNSYEQLMQYVMRQLVRREEETSNNSLYDALFYERLSMTEKLYLPLVKGWESEASSLVGLRKVSLGRGQYALYDTKAHIEAKKHELKAYVPSQWTVPLATQVSIDRKQEGKKGDDCLIEGDFHYKGEDVYIGIVTVESVQLESPFLRTALGKSRISCLWEQEEADQGVYYTGSTIDKLLAKNKIGPKEKSDTTCLLELAGGKYKEQEGIASKSDFLVAKIKPAGQDIQEVCTGEYKSTTVLVADLLIATHKLVELAKLNERPLVLYLPYFYVLVGEEGRNIYDRLLEELSDEPGLTIIMPVGEEADKRHHQLVTGAAYKTFIETQQDKQTIVGVISAENLTAFTAFLQLVHGTGQKVPLDQRGTYKTQAGLVETSGLIWDATSGGLTLRFRIVQNLRSRWQLAFESQENASLRVHINLREMTLGPDATLDTHSSLRTANVAPSKWSVIGVGGFDTKSLAVRGGSGRIDGSCHKRLTLVAEGRGKIWEGDTNQGCWGEGSAVAASFVTGAVATLYSKWLNERGAPYPNTHMMKRWLEQLLVRIPEQEYPHLSQGKGILALEHLQSTLMMPLE